MSITNDIRNLLDIQDRNISFEENCVTKGNFKGVQCKFIDSKLTHDTTHCTKCGVVNDKKVVIKNGTQTSRITLPSAGTSPVYLRLKKQRFLCHACGSSFTAKTSLVKTHCFISNQTKMKVIIQSAEAKSLKTIAQDTMVSAPTVQRIINETAEQYQPKHTTLPKHLSFDEFKYKKGKMAFECIDWNTGDILGILDQRTSRVISNHFIANYSLKARKKVETVTIDMNAGYERVIKNLFPKAKIIIDRFHLVQLISRSMNKCRIQVMNTFRTSNGEDQKKYRRLKAYWRLLLKNEADLSQTEYKYYRMFGQRLEGAVVEELLSYSEVLRDNYRLYQDLLRSMKHRNFKSFEQVINQKQPENISSYMKTSLKTLQKHAEHVIHSFSHENNNGRIEGMNNKIKVLNRIAYGYRNFTNFRNRILIHFKFQSNDISRKEANEKAHPIAA